MDNERNEWRRSSAVRHLILQRTDMANTPAPIFIIGSPRSGTSILTWCLGQHPNILPIEESNWMGKLAFDVHHCIEIGTSRGDRSHLSSMGIRDELYTAIGKGIDELIVSHRQRYEQLWTERHPNAKTTPLRISRHPDDPKQRWVDGTPEYSMYIPGLRKLFPNAKFIHIARDVVSVVRSMMHFASLSGADLVANEQAAYEYWLRTVRGCVEAERAYGSDVVLRIRHKDLVACPEATLRKCLTFVGEEFAPACLEPLQLRINSSRIPESYDPYDPNTDAKLRAEAHELSDWCLNDVAGRIVPDETVAAELDHAFVRRAQYIARAGAAFQSALERAAAVERELETHRSQLNNRVRLAVQAACTFDAIVAIISRGDDALMDLGGRAAWHFPRDDHGDYAGYHPGDSKEAIEHLESLRAKGANYLVIPEPSMWWLDHYKDFAKYLKERYQKVWVREDTGAIFSLKPRTGESELNKKPVASTASAPDNGRQSSSKNIRDVQPARNGIPLVRFQCNICGASNTVPRPRLEREVSSCDHCKSTVRWRSVIHALSLEIYGKSLAIPDFPAMPQLTGIGMTDWLGYAKPLAKKFNYRNTYYHQEPKLDITQPPAEMNGTLDFIITSEVFEHLPPPVSIAFENMRKLLRPGGVVIFTVPYSDHAETIEHFPELKTYEVLNRSGKHVLRNVTAGGQVQEYDRLVFHGGPGATLEMRQFSERGLLAEFKRAGFNNVKIHRTPCEEFGIVWHTNTSLPIAARVD
jgi:SAM-dependent methyltransferase